jgi:hypothetical protein
VSPVYTGELKRKQMVSVLPPLLSLRHLRGRGMFRRARASMETEASLQSTGTYGDSIQTMMGEFSVGVERPRVLGTGVEHLRMPEIDDYTLSEKLGLEREVLGYTVSWNMMTLFPKTAGTESVTLSKELSRHAGLIGSKELL